MKAGLSGFLQHRMSILLYMTLGWALARFTIFFLGHLYYFFHRGERNRITTSLEDVMTQCDPTRDLAKLKRDIFRGIFSHYYEKLSLAFGNLNNTKKLLQDCMTPNHLAKIRAALNRGKGVIIVSGHYGAIEYVPFLMALNGLPVSMIAKFKTPALKRQAFERAAAHGVTIIDGAERGRILQAAIEELRKNRIIITQCDEVSEWRPSRYEAMTFLGKVTEADRTLTLIQKRTGASVIFAVLHRESLKSYKFIVHDCDEISMLAPHLSNLPIGVLILKCLENYICRHPEQWYEWKKYPDIGGSDPAYRRGILPVSVPAVA